VSVTAESFLALCNKGFSFKDLPWFLAIDLHYEHLLPLEAHFVKGGGNEYGFLMILLFTVLESG